MLRVLKEVYRSPVYTIISVVTFVVVMLLATTLPNLGLVGDVTKAFGILAGSKVLFNLLGSLETNFTILSATSTILLAVFFGINISLFVFFIKRYKKITNTASNTGGLLLGVFGVGCASCGSLIIAPLLSLLGVGGLLAFLPLGGEEFAIVGLLLLIYSTYAILKKLSKPLTCEV